MHAFVKVLHLSLCMVDTEPAAEHDVTLSRFALEGKRRIAGNGQRAPGSSRDVAQGMVARDGCNATNQPNRVCAHAKAHSPQPCHPAPSPAPSEGAAGQRQKTRGSSKNLCSSYKIEAIRALGRHGIKAYTN
eukprot:1155215-Pelagomonas_calceolata.AAC.3